MKSSFVIISIVALIGAFAALNFREEITRKTLENALRRIIADGGINENERSQMWKKWTNFVEDTNLFSTRNMKPEDDWEVIPPTYGPPTTVGLEPDAYRNVTELITSKGYGCEQHTATTTDGYELSIQRIIPLPNTVRNTSIVVILQHGLFDSSVTWVLNQWNTSLGFMLANEGFDVWMSNIRGNRYSMSNTHLNPKHRAFWDFSWDEMSSIDLPTIVDYVIDTTGVSQVYYVGHSQGTLMGFTGFSNDAELSSKIKRFFALAPIAHVGHTKGLVPWIAPFHSEVYFVANLIGYVDVFPSTPFVRDLGREFCHLGDLICELGTFAMCGPDWAGFNASRQDVYFANFPSGTSLKNINHWGQMVENDDLRMYSYGWLENPFYYDGKHDAPTYDISTLSVPTALFSGGNDWLADPKDVQYIRDQCSNVIEYDNVIESYNHLDFVWGITAHSEVYSEIISQIYTTL